MPTTTVEFRWFRDGTLPEPVLTWFRDAGATPPSDWEHREDVYLPVPGSHEIGIKCRGDSDLFEVKCRSEALAPVALQPRISGRPEIWTKWSHSTHDQWIALLTRRYPGSCRVQKSRLKRHYHFEASTESVHPEIGGRRPNPREVRPGAEILRGGILEIASLQIAGTAYWSFAMEAFPFDHHLVDDTIAALEPLLDDAPIEVRLEQSMAYPEWLAGVIE